MSNILTKARGNIVSLIFGGIINLNSCNLYGKQYRILKKLKACLHMTQIKNFLLYAQRLPWGMPQTFVSVMFMVTLLKISRK